MRKLKIITAGTPEELALALGLTAADAREWQVQHTLSKRLRDAVKKEVGAEGRYVADESDGDFE